MRHILAHAAKIIPAVALIALASVVAFSFLLTSDSANAFDTAPHNNVAPPTDPQFTAQCSNGVAVLDPANNPGLVSDCANLLASKDTLIGTGAPSALNWSANTGIHNWDGVTIDRVDDASAHRVIYLELAREGLAGTIPTELGNLSNLLYMRLYYNRLAGTIPTELSNLANLQLLELNHNRLTGGIPPELGNLANLHWLYLNNNQLSGEIPSELGDLANLRWLGLGGGGNQFTGCIPDSLRPLLDYAELAEIELPFCDPIPVPSPVLPTATPTSVPSATASPTPSPTATFVPTPVGGDVLTRMSALETLMTEVRALLMTLESRLAALEGSPSTATPTFAPTATPTLTATPTTVVAEGSPTPTATFVASGTPTATPTPDGCVRRLAGIGWITGTWTSGCASDRIPSDPSAPLGVRLARFYTFTLDAPADVAVSLTSADVANTYLYLLSGAGRSGEALIENDNIDAENGNYGSRITSRLPAGSYTIEATTYDLNTAGNFTLSLDISTAP